ncbi:hypothetical protein BZA70DRAFT_311453 [Myxozyma melibiosi]|uniref:Uncharacterized protein n=1 Tax=Myxozyma melibiosi TaxID=54550 RepID=A0ABR1F397_9ASCO
MSTPPFLINETFGCPSPLLDWEPITSDRYVDFYSNNRACYQGCCVPCDYRKDIYVGVHRLILSLMILGIISFSCALFLGLSQIMSRRMVMSEFNLIQAVGLAICVASISWFDVQRHKVVCRDAVTPDLGKNNPRCMLQGLFFVFGFQLSTLAILIRIIALHMTIVWARPSSRKRMAFIVIFISVVFTAAGANYVEFSGGLMCSPTYPQVQYVVYIPIIVYTGIASILQFFTACHIVRTLYRIELSIHYARTQNDPSRAPPWRNKFEIYYRCTLKYLQLGWRTIVFTEFVTCIAVSFSITYFKGYGADTTAQYVTAFTDYLLCMTSGDYSPRQCGELYRSPLGDRTVLIWANVLMASTFVLFATEFRPLLLQGWLLFLRHPRSLISRDLRRRLLDQIPEKEFTVNPIKYYRSRSMDTYKPDPDNRPMADEAGSGGVHDVDMNGVVLDKEAYPGGHDEPPFDGEYHHDGEEDEHVQDEHGDEEITEEKGKRRVQDNADATAETASSQRVYGGSQTNVDGSRTGSRAGSSVHLSTHSPIPLPQVLHLGMRSRFGIGAGGDESIASGSLRHKQLHRNAKHSEQEMIMMYMDPMNREEFGGGSSGAGSGVNSRMGSLMNGRGGDGRDSTQGSMRNMRGYGGAGEGSAHGHGHGGDGNGNGNGNISNSGYGRSRAGTRTSGVEEENESESV